MVKISDWYTTFSDLSFPTVFIKLSQFEVDAIVDNSTGAGKDSVWDRLTHAMTLLPRGLILNADCCAPSDSAAFKRRRILHTPISSWKQLTTSDKVKAALSSGKSDTLCLRPYRRMDRAREFRLFIKDGKLLAASQYNLDKNYTKLYKRQDEIWTLLNTFFTKKVASLLNEKDTVIDVYISGHNDVKIIDFNDWGGETAPLLLRKWDQDFDQFFETRHRLLLLASPVAMCGDVSVSF
ncbi:MAG: hypothetical protein KAG98_03045 [Lentisphaeria bacterium]|nr:hypothetical protein [Lentisphaeria bacterium]